MHASAQALENSVTDGNLRATRILDYHADPVQKVLRQVAPAGDELRFLQRAHQHLCKLIQPIYTVDELQPASLTILKGNGSCSQRFACLEACARAHGIPTRVRGLWVSGRFWAPRFRLMRPILPRKVLLAWPQFHVDGGWLGAESLFASVEAMARAGATRFSNAGESLFDALPHSAIDFEGRTSGCAEGRCNLSSYVVGVAGLFATRDELFVSVPLLQHTIRGWVFELLFAGCASH
jgi:hypothetical protein